MKPGSVIVDVAIDQGGCVATSRPTTHAAPTFVVDDVVHYCVTNMPGAVPRTSTFALTNATLPYVRALADLGWREALSRDAGLAHGLNVHDGKVTFEAVARIAKEFGLPRSAFSYCGLKDKQGRTTQLVAVRGTPVDFQETDLRLKLLGRTAAPLSSENTTSNRFAVTVRDLTEEDLSRLVRAMGSQIVVESVEGQGSTFRFDLELERRETGVQAVLDIREGSRTVVDTIILEGAALFPAADVVAGLPQAPSRYSPVLHPEAARQRRSYVLRRMREDGSITEEERRVADAAPVGWPFAIQLANRAASNQLT